MCPCAPNISSLPLNILKFCIYPKLASNQLLIIHYNKIRWLGADGVFIYLFVYLPTDLCLTENLE
jgi:hypothetical protein